MALLASRLVAFRFQGLLRHHIQLWIQLLTVLLHGQWFQPFMPMAGVVPAFFAAGGEQFVGQKQGPFRFDSLEGGQLIALVMQPADVFHHGLVAVTEESLVAIGTAEFAANPFTGAGDQLGILNGPGGIADHRQTGTIRFLAG